MDEFTTTKSYLRTHTGIGVVVKSIGKKEWKGTESFVVTFERPSDKALIDAKFKLPMNQITKNQYEKLLKACSVTDSKSLVGKELAIQINKSEYNGKFYWNPSSFSPISYLDGYNEVQGVDNGTTGQPKEDDFPF